MSINPFNCISLRELPTWVKVLQEDTNDKEEILKDLELIDDLLTLMKEQSLLTRKRNLKTQLEARIGKSLGHKTPNLNRK